jgi:hypothetical protein
VNVPFAASVTEPPCAVANVPATAVMLSPSMSKSVPAPVSSVSTLPLTDVSSAVVYVFATAVGASFTGVTVMTSLAGALVPPSLSVTVNGIVTVPLKFAAGVKMRTRPGLP